jgi:hypothetical protein
MSLHTWRKSAESSKALSAFLVRHKAMKSLRFQPHAVQHRRRIDELVMAVANHMPGLYKVV